MSPHRFAPCFQRLPASLPCVVALLPAGCGWAKVQGPACGRLLGTWLIELPVDAPAVLLLLALMRRAQCWANPPTADPSPAPPRLDAALCREAIERHTTERCYLPGSEAEPVLPEFPNVAPSGKSRLSGSNGVVPGPLRAGAGAPQAVA